MANITANTLFHFTAKEALLNILKTGFRPNYSLEMGLSFGSDVPELLVPMVCFCDLPISKVERHINGYDWEYQGATYASKKYGQYGLGMTKDWGRRKRLNPVTYVAQESYVMEFLTHMDHELRYLCKELQEMWDKSLVDPTIKNYYNNPIAQFMSIGRPPLPREYATLMSAAIALSNSAAFAGYVKPYTDYRTGQLYYDEREWRCCVPYTRRYDGTAPIFFKRGNKVVPTGQHEFYEADLSYLEECKKNIADKYMLNFTSDDIKYIILKDEFEVHEVIQCMKDVPEKYDGIAIEKLITRIITCDQIREDF